MSGKKFGKTEDWLKDIITTASDGDKYMDKEVFSKKMTEDVKLTKEETNEIVKMCEHTTELNKISLKKFETEIAKVNTT